MKGFKSTSTNPYTYTQDGVWKKGQYTFQAVVLSDSGYAFAFQRADTTWQTVDLSWQVKDGSYSKIQWTFTLEVDAVAFKLIANSVTGETTVLQPMLEKGTNGSTPIAHEEDLRGMDGDNHEFIFTRNTTGIAPETPLSTQDDDLEPIGWTDNPQGVTKELPFEFVSMREKKNGVWLDFSPPSLWAKWGEDGLSVNLLVEGHYKSHWEGTTKVVEIVGGVDVGGNEVVKVSAVFRKGEENIAATVSQSRGFQWYVNGVHLTAFDNQPFITLDETYGDGFADYVVLSYLVNSIRDEERREIINISEGMDGIGEEFIFKANNSDTEPPVLPQTTDVGYQNDDYHGDWSDDPVAPTELNQFVWVAKRKKIGGIWEAFGTPSVWTKWVTDGEPGAGIDTVTDYYATSTSGTTPPTTWYTTMPTKSANEYLWNYEVITYTDGRTPTQTQKRVIQGNDARSIHYIKNAYAYSASDTVSPTSGWEWNLSTLGTKPYGYFLWVREDIAYTDDPTNYISTIGYVVRDGADGADGHSPYISGTTGTWWTWDDAIGQYVNTGYSPVGSDGAIPYPAGYYDNTKWYRREAEYAPYVQYEGALYLLIKDTPNAGIATSNTTYWKAFNNWEAVFVDSLVAQFAKIGGAVFTGDTINVNSNVRGRLISQKGVNNTNDYNTYTGDSGSWQPKLMLDFETGKAVFDEAKIRGEVNATSGVFTGALASPFERTKSTYTKDFSNNLIVTGSTFILPWDQLGSGRLIRLIQPNPGTPYCTAPTGKYFYEDGEQKNTLTMLGAEIIELLGYTDSQGDFTGWLVLNRGLLHTASTWGEPHRIVAHGRVKTNNPFKYHTFDGSTLTTSTNEYNSRKYTSIVMPTKWFDSADGYYVKIIANGGDSAAFHTVEKNTNYTFAVYQHSLNVANGTLSPTTIFDFYFEIYSAAWLYPKSGSGGMPGEEW